jgi:hypothetical protein
VRRTSVGLAPPALSPPRARVYESGSAVRTQRLGKRCGLLVAGGRWRLLARRAMKRWTRARRQPRHARVVWSALPCPAAFLRALCTAVCGAGFGCPSVVMVWVVNLSFMT